MYDSLLNVPRLLRQQAERLPTCMTCFVYAFGIEAKGRFDQYLWSCFAGREPRLFSSGTGLALVSRHGRGMRYRLCDKVRNSGPSRKKQVSTCLRENLISIFYYSPSLSLVSWPHPLFSVFVEYMIVICICGFLCWFGVVGFPFFGESSDDIFVVRATI